MSKLWVDYRESTGLKIRLEGGGTYIVRWVIVVNILKRGFSYKNNKIQKEKELDF